MKKFKRIALILAVIMIAALFTGCGSSEGITVGSKMYTESIVMGEIYAQLIESQTDIPVTRKLNLGDTSVCIPAMQNDELDMYFEYTGTAYSQILSNELQPGMTSDEVLEIARQQLSDELGITMFDPVGQNNTYALAMKTDRINELGITSISDLAAIAPELKFGCGHVFFTRTLDGYEGVTSTYGLEFKEVLKMDTTLLYEAIDAGDLDVIVVFGTDALLKKYELTPLVDDKGVFPPYHGAPVCLTSTLEKYPELNEVLNLLAGKIDDATAQNLNYQVDVEGRPVEEVAAEFLASVGLN